ncbi:MAG: sigma-70 family RNA polymerase sigma factor [Acidobacteriota bacterium]
MSHEFTLALNAWVKGDQSALKELMPVVYDELRRIARRQLRSERPHHTLQATALVNEVYLRLVGQEYLSWESRAHFFGIAAETMRRILVDYARTRRRAKRGGGDSHVTLDTMAASAEQRGVDVIALDDALKSLAVFDPRQSRIVELRFFGGLNNGEIAEVLGISVATVKREWTMARAWLHEQLVASKNHPGDADSTDQQA